MTWFVYAIIAAFGMLFLLLSMLFSGDGDGGDHGGDLGHVDGVEVAGGAEGHGVEGLGGWFSTKVLSAFAVGFGSAGFIGSVAGLGQGGSMLAAVSAGAVMAVAARFIVNMFLKNQGTSHTSENTLLNKVGTVSQTILEGRIGEVEVDNVYRAARSSHNGELRTGAQVRVVSVGQTLTVEPITQKENPAK